MFRPQFQTQRTRPLPRHHPIRPWGRNVRLPRARAMRESKAELTDRLRGEGRFEAFKKRREELKAKGTPAKQAWYEAAAEFPPSADSVPFLGQSRALTKTDF